MVTYQDLLQAQNENRLTDFLLSAIAQHKASDEYRWAVDAETYMRQQNSTIYNYKRLIYDISGRARVDNYSANYKCGSNYFRQNVTQLNQYLLSNGVTFEQEGTKDKLGGADFDNQLALISRSALVQGVCFGFYDFDRVRIFKLTEFVPLWDEEDGALKAGIRFWQIDPTKPLRVTLYTLDGVQQFIRRKGEQLRVMDGYEQPKPYKLITVKAPADTEVIYQGENYAAFPIVPCYGNYERQSELVGKKGNIDAYDLIKSGLANDIDDMQLIYWVLKNAGGMDDNDLREWMESIKYRKVVKTDDEVEVDSHSVEVPYAARETLLKRLEIDIYNDAMTVNTQELANGNVTATAIKAAFVRQDIRADELEYCIIDFIRGLLNLIGVDDNPHFSRGAVVNKLEEAQTVMLVAQYLDDETVREHLSWLTPEEKARIADNIARQDMSRLDVVEDN